MATIFFTILICLPYLPHMSGCVINPNFIFFVGDGNPRNTIFLLKKIYMQRYFSFLISSPLNGYLLESEFDYGIELTEGL